MSSFIDQLRWQFLEKSRYEKPAFLIIGAQKCGTTALYRILCQHSSLVPGIRKELHYFNNNSGKEDAYRSYLKLFPPKDQRKPNTILFEATPLYLYQEDCPARIHDFLPNGRFIVMLRDPAQRALSAWKMYQRFQTEKGFEHMADARSFSQAIEEELTAIRRGNMDPTDYRAYVKRGLYAPQLQRWFRLFSREQILVIEQSEFIAQYDQQIREVQKFLGLRPEPLAIRRETKRVDGSEDYSADLQQLRDFYREPNEQLYELLSRRFNW